MLAMRLCGNGDCAIPIGPTHTGFIMWGRVILAAVVVVLVAVWL